MGTINYVWLGTEKLRALERFNIYSWNLVGFNVGIYTFDYTQGSSHNAQSLGLDPSDVFNPSYQGDQSDKKIAIYDMHALLGIDASVNTEGDPRLLCPDMRTVLLTWYNFVWGVAIPAEWLDPRNPSSPTPGLDPDPDERLYQIYNMVDLTKSYVGATRPGIVLDTKIGPSPHLNAYVQAFGTKFISFTRGSTSPVENQCMGTMQTANTIRSLYATHFNSKVKALRPGCLRTPKNSYFGQFTQYHSQFFTNTETKVNTLNVTLQAPDGTLLRNPRNQTVNSNYSFNEIGTEKNDGPFRVFKKKDDQSNSSSSYQPKTTPAEVKVLAQYVWSNELQNYPKPNGRSQIEHDRYRARVRAALDALPDA